MGRGRYIFNMKPFSEHPLLYSATVAHLCAHNETFGLRMRLQRWEINPQKGSKPRGPTPRSSFRSHPQVLDFSLCVSRPGLNQRSKWSDSHCFSSMWTRSHQTVNTPLFDLSPQCSGTGQVCLKTIVQSLGKSAYSQSR